MTPILMRFLPAFLRDWVAGNDSLTTILDNVGWLFLDKVLRMGAGVALGVWTAAYLGPERFGALNFAMAFAGIFGVLASLGLDAIAVRDIARNEGETYQIIASIFVMKLLGGGLALLLALVAIFSIRPTDSQAHWLVGILSLALLFQCFDAVDLWFQSQLQSRFMVVARNAAFLASAAVKVFLILSGAEVAAFAWAGLGEAMLGAAGMMFFYLRRQSLFLWRPQWRISLRLLAEGWPLVLSGFAVVIYMRIDQVMLAEILDQREVGLYAAALRLSEIWYFIPGIIVSSLLPLLSREKLASEERYLVLLQRVSTVLVRVAYLIAVPMTFASSWIISSLYGAEYRQAGAILAVHIWTSCFVFLGVASTLWTVNESTMKYSLYQTLAGAALNIGLNLVLIPRYGGVGAALATLVSQATASFAANAFLPRMKGLFLIQLRALLRPL